MISKIFSKLYFLTVILLISCHTWDIDHDTKLDPVTKMTRQEIEQNLLRPTQPRQLKPKRTIVPKSSSELPKYFKTLVTLSITESASLKDVFFQIARQAKINLSVDPAVKGGASLQVINRPLIDVIREVCAVNRLRYRLDNDILRIEPDQPYLQNYNVQFLSLKRENKNQILVTNDILNGSTQDTHSLGNHNTVGSNTVLTGETKNNFWQELEQTLTTVLKNNGDGHEAKSSFSIHKQAGLISVHATQAQQHQVEKFIHMLRLSMSSQVLIEAKIVEVTLKDEFKTGINWNLLKGDFILQAPFGDLSNPGKFDPKGRPVRDVMTLGGSGNQLTELVSLMNKFGSVRTLSSPRLSAMNNEPGFMEVATNFVYFTIDYNRDYGFNFAREHESISSKVQTVPIGLVMVVQPSINSEDGSITLSLKLMLSRMIDKKKAPSVDRLITQDSYVPEVQSRVFDSLVHLKSGGTVVMGGLMEEFAHNGQSGVPGLMDIPVIGHLAKSQADERHVSELVIFLKVTIVDDEDHVAEKASSVNPTDLHLYGKFAIDPRPLSSITIK